jgi:putative serine/threonine protein kinase
MQSMRSLQQNDISRSLDPSSPELFDVISYPKFNPSEYLDRINEIRLLGVKSIISKGSLNIGKVSIVGKGTVSIVLGSKFRDNRICALKIRRIDSNRHDMDQEARMHTKSNSVGVGPKILTHSRNIILMELIEGPSMINWVKRFDNTTESETILEIVSSILEQCHSLDRLNVDHGQLHNLNHHIIISESAKATILDFESASDRRRTSNVTSASNSLFFSGHISKRITDILRLQLKKKQLVRALQIYKLSHKREDFEEIMYLLKK